LYTGTKKKTMQLSLCNEDGNDDDVRKMDAREIQLFPQDLSHGFPTTESEFSVFEWSSSDIGGLDVALDLSLQLSSSSCACHHKVWLFKIF
jgi:hypothetical protein